MKRSFLTVILALICTLGFAQVSFNAKAGLNLSTHMGDGTDDAKFLPGARVGVGLEYQFSDLVSLQPSLFFSMKGAKYSGEYSLAGTDVKGDIKFKQYYLELPINVQFRVNIVDNTNFVFATGPYLAYGVGGKTSVSGSGNIPFLGNVSHSEDVKTFDENGLNFKPFDAGWNIGAGLEFGQFLVGLNTQLGFCKLHDDLSWKNANIGINVGVKF